MNAFFTAHTATATHTLATALVPASAPRSPARATTWPSTHSSLRPVSGTQVPTAHMAAPVAPQARTGLLPRPQAPELLYAAGSVLLPFLLAAALLLG